MKEGNSLDDSVDLQIENQGKKSLESRQQVRASCVIPVGLSCPNNSLGNYDFAPNEKSKHKEKMDIAQTRFLGSWNSEKGCMEWTKFVGEVKGYLEDLV
jgi:hypothetical protein